jgi:N-acetylneuraminic acid mutarotase
MIKRNTSQICLWVGMVLMLAVSAKASTLDPGTWSQTGDLNFAREYHTATLLPNGKVLVAGGGMYSSTSELYDPATGVWTQTGNLNFARSYHTATLLPNGKVLVAGGYGSSSYLVQSELYNPATGTWTQTGNLNFARSYHTATLLPNGKVLVAGYRLAELFRSKTNAMPWLQLLLE